VLVPVGLDLPLAESLVTGETGRDARIEEDVLEMLRIIRELRREHEKITWRKE
jgi:hypothetical protein